MHGSLIPRPTREPGYEAKYVHGASHEVPIDHLCKLRLVKYLYCHGDADLCGNFDCPNPKYRSLEHIEVDF